MLRSCYETACNFFPDRPDLKGVIRWFFVDEEAPILPFPTVFDSRNWWDYRDGDGGTLGEVKGAPRPWRDGAGPEHAEDGTPCGEKESWLLGCTPTWPPAEGWIGIGAAVTRSKAISAVMTVRAEVSFVHHARGLLLLQSALGRERIRAAIVLQQRFIGTHLSDTAYAFVVFRAEAGIAGFANALMPVRADVRIGPTPARALLTMRGDAQFTLPVMEARIVFRAAILLRQPGAALVLQAQSGFYAVAGLKLRGHPNEHAYYIVPDAMLILSAFVIFDPDDPVPGNPCQYFGCGG